jgi:Mrp family chromosome partitioning ATPase
MGRMLEALKQADTQRLAPRLASLPANDESLAPEAAETEVPFIEWGPRKSMEASPSVLAAPGPVGRLLRVPRPADAETVALVPPAASVEFRPLARTKVVGKPSSALVAFHDPNGALSVQYREMLKSLLVARLADEPQMLLFTTAHAGSGTTTTLLNTAITAAQLGRRRIAVVDANLSKPGIAAALALAEKPGLREVLAGVTTLDDALQETAQANLTALTAGLTLSTGGVRFMAETLRSLLRHLRERFDLIFVDTGAWDGKAESANLAAACDAVYLVLPPNETDTPAVDELFRRIPEQGATLAGCILVGR